MYVVRCSGGKRLQCPPGVYGREPGLRSRTCSAPCPAGYYCPAGTATPLVCGAANLYCPLGSATPTSVPVGYFSIGFSANSRMDAAICPPGNFCVDGNQVKCPAGTYGAISGLSSKKCSGDCPSGHYCPIQTTKPIACPGGTYGAITGLTAPQCSGRCLHGYYCPPGSMSPTERVCGPNVFCPEGSSSPSKANNGAYVINGDSGVASRALLCPIGSYCSPFNNSGTAQLCPAGTFGSTMGLTTSSCSGNCARGFFCPQGSTIPTQMQCGSVDVYCPIGSDVPIAVSPGYYTISEDSKADPTSAATMTTRSAQIKCQPGYYCISGERFPCPAGIFGGSFGLMTPQCSGPCTAGFYCPEASIVSKAFSCGSSAVYCPEGSPEPIRASKGYCTIRDTQAPATQRSDQRLALPGEFAWKGTCYPCPAGSYGSRDGENDPACEGICEAGYFCPPGSISATQFECGLNATVFCPRGSVAPVNVMDGYYTSIADNGPLVSVVAIDDGVLARECGPGLVRDEQASALVAATNNFMDLVTGLSPIGVNYRDYLFPVASCELCPLGTFKRTDAGDDPALCQPCPPMISTSTSDRRTCECYRLPGGFVFDISKQRLHFDRDALTCVAVPVDLPEASLVTATSSGNPSDGRVTTRSLQLQCEPGYYCQRGVRFPCPAGSYGNTRQETQSSCSGSCAPGFYCPLASTNATAIPCGDGPSVFCPAGSKIPTPVWSGYYTIRSSALAISFYDDRQVRAAQLQCEPGYYCSRGEKFLCPAGRYGNQVGETSPLCTGVCKRGYYCPLGSTSPTEFQCGSSSNVCRIGSPYPISVLEGYYTVGGLNSTRFHQLECEPGYFCMGGVKFQCPAGTYGATYGLTTSACSGKCKGGYYCPSYPFVPSTSPTQNECGSSSLFCPEGTGNYPLIVSSGFFTVGAGDSDGITNPEILNLRNTTRISQQICPPGFYCRNGISIRCPPGTYGDVEGLSDAHCRGWCPAGYYCPPGTSNYQPNACPVGTYAPRGSSACTSCPATMVANRLELMVARSPGEQPCTNDRSCCYLG